MSVSLPGRIAFRFTNLVHLEEGSWLHICDRLGPPSWKLSISPVQLQSFLNLRTSHHTASTKRKRMPRGFPKQALLDSPKPN